MKYSPLPPERVREIEEHLDRLLEPQLELPAARDPVLFALAREHYQFVSDCLMVGISFLLAFDGIKSGELTPPPERDHLIKWTRSADANLRSGRIVANMLALQLCAALDDRLPALVRRGRTISSVFKDDWKRLGGANLVVRPTARAADNWPEALFILFRVQSDAIVVEGLRDLLHARNCAAHELPVLTPALLGDHMATWGKATLWLFTSLTLALDPLVASSKRRRK